jgi:hypothetical protein
MADNSRAINRVFTCGVISDLLKSGSNDVFDCVVRRNPAVVFLRAVARVQAIVL